MVIAAIGGSLLAAGANLWPTIAEAAQATAERHAPEAAAATEAAAHRRTAAKPIAADTGPPAPVPRPEAAWRTGRWEAPVGSLDPATGFDPPPFPWLPGHRGVDLAAATDHPVAAVGSGTVVFAGTLAGRGVVSIDHPGGIRTTYEPVAPAVHEGDTVSAGQTVGYLAAGHASCPAAACLHLGLKRGSAYLDPLLLFGWGQVRLLPRPTGEAP